MAEVAEAAKTHRELRVTDATDEASAAASRAASEEVEAARRRKREASSRADSIAADHALRELEQRLELEAREWVNQRRSALDEAERSACSLRLQLLSEAERDHGGPVASRAVVGQKSAPGEGEDASGSSHADVWERFQEVVHKAARDAEPASILGVRPTPTSADGDRADGEDDPAPTGFQESVQWDSVDRFQVSGRILPSVAPPPAVDVSCDDDDEAFGAQMASC